MPAILAHCSGLRIFSLGNSLLKRHDRGDLETDPNEWSSKGPAFLNKFLDHWEDKELERTIESQIKSD